MKRTLKEIQIESTAKALKRARELRGLSRLELGKSLNLSSKAVEKWENGRYLISETKLKEILEAIEINGNDLLRLKNGKNIVLRSRREKKVLKNEDRRSYNKRITKQCEVLKSLRRSKNITQYKASELCGYSKASIGHIENGRIELTNKRIKHIVLSYGLQLKDFDEAILLDEQRDIVVDSCLEKIRRLDKAKLALIKNLLGSF